MRALSARALSVRARGRTALRRFAVWQASRHEFLPCRRTGVTMGRVRGLQWGASRLEDHRVHPPVWLAVEFEPPSHR